MCSSEEKKKKKKTCPWITPDTVKMIYKRDYLKAKSDSLQWNKILKEYRKLRNRIIGLIIKNKHKHFNDITNKYKADSKKPLERITKGKKQNNNTESCNLDCSDVNDYLFNIRKV